MTDVSMENLAPDTDAIVVRIDGEWQIDVWRDEDGAVHVLATDLAGEGGQTDMVLGVEGETQRLGPTGLDRLG